ncbi:hypothetical protein H9P43_001786 [Blastocladiella emersonii ATCC 22665]|nr:hypothetical protein H9P43_001786 [Blastocladiella emersonii ATCC 22665]
MLHFHRHLATANPRAAAAVARRSLSSRRLPFLFSPHLVPVQVWGANTDVGKTILSAALCRAASETSSRPGPVWYLKPVQTGFPADSDARHVAAHVPRLAGAEVIHTFRDPVSPHRAAADEGRDVPDDLLRADTERYLAQFWDKAVREGKRGWAFVETAGGVLSPSCTGALQADAYRALRLPGVLVGDPKLGGIATTLASAEALYARGYDVDAVVMFAGSHANHDMLARHLGDRTPVFTLPPPPPRAAEATEDHHVLGEYYASIVHEPAMRDAVAALEDAHARRRSNAATLADRARTKIWYPFTQHTALDSGAAPIQVVDSAYADDYLVAARVPSRRAEDAGSASAPHEPEFAGQRLFDGPASWWTQTLGHGNPTLVKAAAAAAGRYGHVIFPETAHAPAVELAERLLERVVPDSMRDNGRVFFTDNGSTATEVALKMALHWTRVRLNADPKAAAAAPKKLKLLGTMGSYHGDTMGVMDACAPSVYNATVPWYDPKGHWIDPPTLAWSAGKLQVTLPWDKTSVTLAEGTNAHKTEALFDAKRLETPLAEVYATQIRAFLAAHGSELGAVMIEPVMQGAGGMMWIDPLFHRVLVREVRRGDWNPHRHAAWQGDLPVIYDEVFTGMWRLGPASVSQWLESPDIVCYAKSLTGGMMPLAVTCATDAIFRTFLGPDKASALLHGHSYTANPIACAVAVATLDAMAETVPHYDRHTHAVASVWDTPAGKALVDRTSRVHGVRGVVAMGTVFAFEIAAPGATGGYNAQGPVADAVRRVLAGARARGVFLRPLGNVIYLMASHTTPREDVLAAAQVLVEEVEAAARVLVASPQKAQQV